MISAISVILLVASDIAVSGQTIKRPADPNKSDMTRRAEEYFQEALSLSVTGDHKLARDRLSQAIHLWIQMREPEKAARASLQIGDYLRRTKSFQESLIYYSQGLDIRPISAETKALAFKAIASIYVALYHRDLAEKYFKQSIEEARAAKNSLLQAEAYGELAALYYQLGDKKQAIASITEARNLNRLQGNADIEAAMLHLMGLMSPEHEALKALEDALRIYQKTNNIEMINVLCSMSALYLSLGQNQSSLDRAQQANKLMEMRLKAATDAERLGLRELRWRACLALARAQRAVGEKDLARKSYFRATGNIEAIWLSVTSATDVGAIAFGELRQAPYSELAGLMIDLGRIDEGFHVAEQAKARAILGLIVARKTAGPLKLDDHDGALSERTKSIASRRTQLLSLQLTSTERAKLEREIEELESALEEAQAKAEMARSQKGSVWFQPPSISQVREKLIHNQDYLLQFFMGEKRSFAWLVSSDNLSVKILPGRKEIEQAVEQYIAVISKRPNYLYLERRLFELKELGEKLSAMLLGELAEHLGPSKRLIVVPDGILNYLPFEALISNGRYLIEDHEISYLSSASMLELLQDRRSITEGQDKKEILAFGNPDFGFEPKALKARGARGSIKENGEALRAFDGFNLAALPGTREEVEGICALFAPGKCRMYIGKESTEEAVKAEQLKSYRRLHFATHSFVDQRNPARSAVILTLDKDPQEDGFLEIGEITSLNLDSDLVVLSACQTGRGKLFSGEGVVGLSRAFLYAGARSVVVSLWSVSDNSTSQFMKGFYKNISMNVGNSAALRKAKLDMIERGRETRHPYYWAPFIIVGKP